MNKYDISAILQFLEKSEITLAFVNLENADGSIITKNTYENVYAVYQRETYKKDIEQFGGTVRFEASFIFSGLYNNVDHVLYANKKYKVESFDSINGVTSLHCNYYVDETPIDIDPIGSHKKIDAESYF